MPRINPQIPSDGDDVTAASVDTAFNSIINLLNGLLDQDNIADEGITLAKLAHEAWTSFAPTWTATGSNPAIGNGSIGGRYTRIGSTVMGSIALSAGSSTTFGAGSWRFNLPVAVAAGAVVGALGSAALQTNGGANLYVGTVAYSGSSKCEIWTPNWVVSGSVPFSWATGSSLGFSFMYEAA